MLLTCENNETSNKGATNVAPGIATSNKDAIRWRPLLLGRRPSLLVTQIFSLVASCYYFLPSRLTTSKRLLHISFPCYFLLVFGMFGTVPF